MAWADIVGQIKVWNTSVAPWVLSKDPDENLTDFSSAEENQIFSYLGLLYLLSPTYAATLLDSVSIIRIGKSTTTSKIAFVALGATGQG
jgi:hypothetical protein